MSIRNTISPRDAVRFYDGWDKQQRLADLFEERAKQWGLDVLHLEAGHRAINVGVGPGAEYAEMLRRVGPRGFVVGLDLAPAMIYASRQRGHTAGFAQPAVLLGSALRLPHANASFDRLFSSYMLDLLPAPDIPRALAEFWRVLRPGGRLALVGLTEGEDVLSQSVMSIWKQVYRVEPCWLGGCRPLQLRDTVREAGFTFVQRWYVSQRGYPSEVVSGVKPA